MVYMDRGYPLLPPYCPGYTAPPPPWVCRTTAYYRVCRVWRGRLGSRVPGSVGGVYLQGVPTGCPGSTVYIRFLKNCPGYTALGGRLRKCEIPGSRGVDILEIPGVILLDSGNILEL